MKQYKFDCSRSVETHLVHSVPGAQRTTLHATGRSRKPDCAYYAYIAKISIFSAHTNPCLVVSIHTFVQIFHKKKAACIVCTIFCIAAYCFFWYINKDNLKWRGCITEEEDVYFFAYCRKQYAYFIS